VTRSVKRLVMIGVAAVIGVGIGVAVVSSDGQDGATPAETTQGAANSEAAGNVSTQSTSERGAGGGSGSAQLAADSAIAGSKGTSGHRGGPGVPQKGTIPARISNPNQEDSGGYPFSEELLVPRNSWGAGSHRRLTAVYAGAYEGDQSRGAFVIFRQNFIQVTQHFDVVQVPEAAAVKITSAPLGKNVVRSAQRSGKLHFSDRNGVTGVLHLKDDTVSLDR
jgi:hypothetical protein